MISSLQLIHPVTKEVVYAHVFLMEIREREKLNERLTAYEQSNWRVLCAFDDYQALQEKKSKGLLDVCPSELHVRWKCYELIERRLCLAEQMIQRLRVRDTLFVDASAELHVESIFTCIESVEDESLDRFGLDIFPRGEQLRFTFLSYILHDRDGNKRGLIMTTTRGVFYKAIVDGMDIRRVFKPEAKRTHYYGMRGGDISDFLGRPHLLFDPRLLSSQEDVEPLLLSSHNW